MIKYNLFSCYILHIVVLNAMYTDTYTFDDNSNRAALNNDSYTYDA